MFLKKTFICPVCKTSLGRGSVAQTEVFHCSECKAWLHFYPDDRKPKMTLDREKDKSSCGCGGCGR